MNYFYEKPCTRTILVQGSSFMEVICIAYFKASETKRSWKEVQNVAGVNRESFEKAYRLMLRWAKELFPKGFIFATPIDQLPRPYECK